MVKTERYTQQQVITALKECKGLITYTARRLGCSADTVLRYTKRYPAVAQANYDARCEVLDMAELKLFELIANGDMRAIEFLLSRLGRDRGYVERHEVTGENGQPLASQTINVVNVVIPEDSVRMAAVLAALRDAGALPEGDTGTLALDGASNEIARLTES